VLLQTLKFTLLVVGYLMMVSTPFALGIYPVTPVGSELKSAMMVSVAAVPVADVVTTLAQVPEEMAPVPSAEVPLAMVAVQVGQDTAPVAATTMGAVPLRPALPTLPMGSAPATSLAS